MIRPLLLVALAAVAIPAAAQTAPEIAKMRAAIAADRERNVALLERLVNQNSGTLNLAGVRAAGDILRPEFERLGFTVAWIDQAAAGRAGHLVATHRGNGRGKRMLLIGHLDTVFEPTSPFQRFERKGDTAVGPGVGDMKGGDVIIVAALRALAAAGPLKDAAFGVYLVGDEERTGTPLATARGGLIAAGKAADVVLEYENLVVDDGRDMGTVARRSATNWTLRTKGRAGHSGGVGRGNRNWGAIYEMTRILDAFRRELPEENATFNVGVIGGGTPAQIDAAELTVTASGKTNIIAETGIARGDLRTLTPEQDTRLREKMAAIVAAHLADTDAALTFGDTYPPVAPTAGNRALLATLNALNRQLGLSEMGEVEPARRGAADSGFTAPYADTLAGLGIDGVGSHAPGESADLASIPRQALRSAALMTRLSRERRAK